MAQGLGGAIFVNVCVCVCVSREWVYVWRWRLLVFFRFVSFRLGLLLLIFLRFSFSVFFFCVSSSSSRCRATVSFFFHRYNVSHLSSTEKCDTKNYHTTLFNEHPISFQYKYKYIAGPILFSALANIAGWDRGR